MPAYDSNPTNTLDRESLRSLGDALEKHFPHPIEETELVLLEISPHRLHAYWHITPWELESAASRADDEHARLILRFHDLTEDALQQNIAPSFDIEISGASGSHYVELWEDARRYNAELGVLADDGQLIDLARSNTVELPKADHSAQSGTRVLTLTPLADELFAQPPSNDEEAAGGSRKARKTWQADDSQPNDATLRKGLSALFPLFPDPLAPVFEAHTLDLDLAAEKTILASTSAPAINTPESLHKPFATLSAAGTAEPGEADGFPLCSVADAHALAEESIVPLTPLESLQAAASKVPTGFAFAPVVDGQKGSSPTEGKRTGQADLTDSPASSQSLSSFSLADGPRGELHTELHVELHIHGRAQPNSHFVFHGLPIATQADGSFSLQKKLPLETQQLVARLLAASDNRAD